MKLLHLYSNYVLIVFILGLTWQLGSLKADLKALKGTIVDIDELRNQFATEAEYFYNRGCRVGTEYPDKFKLPTNMFNPNSPVNYCNQSYKQMESYVYDQIKKLGK